MITVLYICTDIYKFAGSSLSLMNMLSATKESVHPIILVADEGEVAEGFRKQGYEVIIHHFFIRWIKHVGIKQFFTKFRSSPLYRFVVWDWSCLFYLSKRLKGRKIDIVHTNTSITTVGVKLARHLNAKHIWHIREFLDIDFQAPIYGGISLLKRTIDKADYRICITHSVASHWGFKNINTSVLYNAIVPNRDYVINYRKEKYYLFCAAFLTENKGTLDAVESFLMSGLHKSGYSLKLVGICSDSIKESIMELSNKYKACNSITICGSQQNLEPFYRNASALLMCSKNEALGRVTVEAMYYGCPVIGRNSGGTSEIIKDGVTGFKFDSLSECASQIKYVSEHNVSDVIDNAYSFALTSFNEEMYGEEIHRIYSKVCSNKS